MRKEECIARLETIINETGNDGTYNYEIGERGWENYGKSRTYFKVFETRENSKHNATYDFGYLDNNTGEYVAGGNDLTKNANLSGAKF